MWFQIAQFPVNWPLIPLKCLFSRHTSVTTKKKKKVFEWPTNEINLPLLVSLWAISSSVEITMS